MSAHPGAGSCCGSAHAQQLLWWQRPRLLKHASAQARGRCDGRSAAVQPRAGTGTALSWAPGCSVPALRRPTQPWGRGRACLLSQKNRRKHLLGLVLRQRAATRPNSDGNSVDGSRSGRCACHRPRGAAAARREQVRRHGALVQLHHSCDSRCLLELCCARLRWLAEALLAAQLPRQSHQTADATPSSRSSLTHLALLSNHKATPDLPLLYRAFAALAAGPPALSLALER